MPEACGLNEPSDHLLESCVVSGNEVKLPLMWQTDRQIDSNFCVGIRMEVYWGLLRSVVPKSVRLIPICVQMS